MTLDTYDYANHILLISDGILRRVPFFATSTTLDNRLLKKIIDALRFAEDIRVIRESIDKIKDIRRIEERRLQL